MLDPDDTPVDEDLGGQDLLAELNKLTLNDQRSRRKVGVMYNVTTEIVVKFGGEVRSMFYWEQYFYQVATFLLESNDEKVTVIY